MTTPPSSSQTPRYEPHESPPHLVSLGLGLQYALIASATIVITPVIVAGASGRDDSYLVWMVFASVIGVGVGTLLQVVRIGPVGAGAVLTMRASVIAIPFCIMAIVEGGPAMLATLVLFSAAFQIVIAKWLFVLRRIITPTVSGTVMMIVTLALASVLFNLLDEASGPEPLAAPITTLTTLVVVAVLTLRGSDALRLWAPVIGIVAGCLSAVAFGTYDIEMVMQAPWAGVPLDAWPGLGVDFGTSFWTLLPAFLFLSVIISMQVNGDSIALQRVSWRQARAIDYREVQRAASGVGVTNLISGIIGTVPNVSHGAVVSFIQITGSASRNMGFCIGVVFLVVAFLPKVSGLLSTIPGPVMTGYLLVVIGILFMEGARTVVQDGLDRRKAVVAGVSFWIGAAFEYGLLSLQHLGPVWGTLFQSGITTGGLTAIALVIFLELTGQRRMRFQSQLHVEALPELNAFLERFAARRGWNAEMTDRLSAVAEETLLALAPPDEDQDDRNKRRSVVLASSDGPVAELEFIGATSEENLEDRVRQLQQHDSETPTEHEFSLRMLRHYAASVKHQQWHGTDIVTVRVGPVGTR